MKKECWKPCGRSLKRGCVVEIVSVVGRGVEALYAGRGRENKRQCRAKQLIHQRVDEDSVCKQYDFFQPLHWEGLDFIHTNTLHSCHVRYNWTTYVLVSLSESQYTNTRILLLHRGKNGKKILWMCEYECALLAIVTRVSCTIQFKFLNAKAR